MVFAHDTEVALDRGRRAGQHRRPGRRDAARRRRAGRVLPTPTAGPAGASTPRPSCGRCGTLRPRLRRIWDGRRGRASWRSSTGCCASPRRCPSWSGTTAGPYHLHATPADAPLATRMAVEAAMAFVDVVRGGELGRLRICEFPDCGNVVVDLSKNRSKRFCDAGCGNRAAVTAYRARKAPRPAADGGDNGPACGSPERSRS